MRLLHSTCLCVLLESENESGFLPDHSRALRICDIIRRTRAPLISVVVAAGIGVGIVWTNSDTLVSTLAGKGQLGASIGAAQSFKEFGDMVGSSLVGLLTQFFGVRIGFVSCGVHCVGIFLLADARTSRIDAELAALVRQSVKSA